VTARACLFDDVFSFGADGSFNNIMGDATWLEAWQGADEGCGAPVAPHDGYGAATYSYDATAGTLTVSGAGAHVGLPKVINGGEISDPANAAALIVYEVTELTDTTMTLDINFGPGYWRFKLVDAASVAAPTAPEQSTTFDVTFAVDMNGVDLTAGTPTVNGTFNGWCGECNALSDDDADGVWTTTLPLPVGDYEYKFTIGNWAGQEAVPGACGLTTGENINRTVSVTDAAVTLEVTPYNGCAGPDSDGDGHNNDVDAFPMDPTEHLDSDGDSIGNNADPDDDNDGVEDGADQDPLDPSVGALPAQTVTVTGEPSASAGKSVTIAVGYDVENGNSSLTGLGLRVHYNSSLLSFDQFADVLTDSPIDSGSGPFNDTEDLDNDPTTDKYVTAAWASLFGTWPGTLPETLVAIDFTVAEVAEDQEPTTISFSSSSNAAGYRFEGVSYDLPFVSATWDFDSNGTADALTDGLLLLRHTFGLRDAQLTNGAIAPDSPLSAAEVQDAVAEAYSIADIDGNGAVDALTDGLMLLRYLFGLSGDQLINGAVSPDATRTTAAEIQGYIDANMP